MFEIRNVGQVTSAPTVNELLCKLSTMAGADVAIHFRRRNGMKRVVFVSVTPSGKAVYSYGMGNELSEGDFAL